MNVSRRTVLVVNAGPPTEGTATTSGRTITFLECREDRAMIAYIFGITNEMPI